MLFLMRQVNDKGIVMELPDGQLVEIFVDRMNGKQVTLGFRNGENVGIWRGEVWDKMQKDKLNHYDH